MADITPVENVPLAGYSTFRCGGPAKYFAEPSTGDEVASLFRWAEDRGLEVFVLGNGSNCLISDEGFNGLVIRIAKNMSGLSSEDAEDGRVLIKAGAGLPCHGFRQGVHGSFSAAEKGLSVFPRPVKVGRQRNGVHPLLFLRFKQAQGCLYIGGTVVHARKNVGMQVDHSLYFLFL